MIRTTSQMHAHEPLRVVIPTVTDDAIMISFIGVGKPSWASSCDLFLHNPTPDEVASWKRLAADLAALAKAEGKP